MGLFGLTLGKRLRRKHRRAIWLVVGSVGIGLVLFGLGTTLDDESPNPMKFLLLGLVLIALAAIQYNSLSGKNRGRRHRRSRRGQTASAGPQEHPTNLT
jgi:hypothetical protein